MIERNAEMRRDEIVTSNPAAQTAAQVGRILASSGKTVADFARLVQDHGIERHSAMISYFKSTHGLGHGDANALAHAVREAMAGGSPATDTLLSAQYADGKAPLRPIYEALEKIAEGMGGDVEKIVQKTGVSFRGRKQFALVQAPSAKRIQLGLNLDVTPDDPRVIETTGMCTHRVDIVGIGEVDDDVTAWIRASYDRAG